MGDWFRPEMQRQAVIFPRIVPPSNIAKVWVVWQEDDDDDDDDGFSPFHQRLCVVVWFRMTSRTASCFLSDGLSGYGNDGTSR